LGLCLGSFVNALVWRLRQRSLVHSSKSTAKKLKGLPAKDSQLRTQGLSILKGRSMCPHCHRELNAKDLIPILSWLSLKGKCRYCGKKIDDSPMVELIMPVLFVFSYLYWPAVFNTNQTILFSLWLVFLTDFILLFKSLVLAICPHKFFSHFFQILVFSP
jgi:prepilin signal peptidase PulO-like enzyme (type II secretory pathway)